jgi:hypothetical protein
MSGAHFGARLIAEAGKTGPIVALLVGATPLLFWLAQ